MPQITENPPKWSFTSRDSLAVSRIFKLPFGVPVLILFLNGLEDESSPWLHSGLIFSFLSWARIPLITLYPKHHQVLK